MPAPNYEKKIRVRAERATAELPVELDANELYVGENTTFVFRVDEDAEVSPDLQDEVESALLEEFSDAEFHKRVPHEDKVEIRLRGLGE